METGSVDTNGEMANLSPQKPRTLMEDLELAQVKRGVSLLQEICGTNARNSGWHADRPVQSVFADAPGFVEGFDETDEMYAARLRNWQIAKIMLMVTELAEGVEELRNGHSADDSYYVLADHDIVRQQEYMNGVPQFKPEGLPSELADTLIRILDFCYTEGIDLSSMILEKLAFNRTRGVKHGGKAI